MKPLELTPFIVVVVVAIGLVSGGCSSSDTDGVSPSDGGGVSAESSADTGGGGGGGAELDAGPPRRVFVTSGFYDGNLGGYGGATAKCNELAASAGLPKTFKPWLSVGAESAASKLNFRGGYVLLNSLKTVVASNRAEVIGGSHKAAIDVDENGAILVGTNKRVWTNTNKDGEVARSGQDCTGFTSNKPADSTAVGEASAKDGTWTEVAASGGTCSEVAHLYCFED